MSPFQMTTLKIETPEELAARLGLAGVLHIHGFALWYEKGEKKGYVQNLTFRFDTLKSDKNSFGYTVLKQPTNKTKPESFIYDLETAVMVQHMFNWHASISPKIHYIFSLTTSGNAAYKQAEVLEILC